MRAGAACVFRLCILFSGWRSGMSPVGPLVLAGAAFLTLAGRLPSPPWAGWRVLDLRGTVRRCLVSIPPCVTGHRPGPLLPGLTGLLPQGRGVAAGSGRTAREGTITQGGIDTF